MDGNETVLLDAELEFVIDNHAFRARLKNGHTLVAFIKTSDRDRELPKAGDFVKVEVSPYNMGTGRIILGEK